MRTPFILICMIILMSACGHPRTHSSQNILSDKEIRFAFGSSRINSKSRLSLQENIDLLKQDQEKSVIVEGHTDRIGSMKTNLDLGDKRARAVKAFLIACGIDSDRILTVTYGESQPKQSVYHYSENRRALIKDLAK